MGKPRVENFLGIGGTDRRDRMSRLDSALENVYVTAVFKQGLFIHGNAQHILQNLHAVFALILNIMDGQHGFDVFKALVLTVEKA